MTKPTVARTRVSRVRSPPVEARPRPRLPRAERRRGARRVPAPVGICAPTRTPASSHTAKEPAIHVATSPVKMPSERILCDSSTWRASSWAAGRPGVGVMSPCGVGANVVIGPRAVAGAPVPAQIRGQMARADAGQLVCTRRKIAWVSCAAKLDRHQSRRHAFDRAGQPARQRARVRPVAAEPVEHHRRRQEHRGRVRDAVPRCPVCRDTAGRRPAITDVRRRAMPMPPIVRAPDPTGCRRTCSRSRDVELPRARTRPARIAHMQSAVMSGGEPVRERCCGRPSTGRWPCRHVTGRCSRPALPGQAKRNRKGAGDAD